MTKTSLSANLFVALFQQTKTYKINRKYLMKILVVEDEADMRSIVQMIFLKLGHKVLTAASGHEAMRILEEDHEIEVILTDVNCSTKSGSGDDGIWLAEKFNQAFSTRASKTPLFFMTGELMEGQEKKIRTITSNPVIDKQVAIWSSVLATLENAVRSSRQPAQHQAVTA